MLFNYFTGNRLVSEQGKRVSQLLPAAEQSSVKKSTSLKPTNILVHFECGELELYPMRITTIHFNQFYDEVTQVWCFCTSDNGFISHHLLQ